METVTNRLDHYRYPANLVLVPRERKWRFFRHKDGFVDGTDVLEYTPRGSCIRHMTDGRMEACRLRTLPEVEEMVRQGYWIEVDGPTPKPTQLVPWERDDVPFHPGEAYIVSPGGMCERLVTTIGPRGISMVDMQEIPYDELLKNGWKWAKCNSTDEPKPCGKEAK